MQTNRKTPVTRSGLRQCGKAAPSNKLSVRTVPLFDLRDNRNVRFWLLVFSQAAYFLVSVAALVHLRRQYFDLDLKVSLDPTDTLPYNASIAIEGPEATPTSYALQLENNVDDLSIDVWFTLGLMATIDAFAVVMSFNRKLVIHFHYAVSMRLMLFACAVPFGAMILNTGNFYFLPNNPLPVFTFCFLTYVACGHVLDLFEPPRSKVMKHLSLGTLQKYSQVLANFDVPWRKAVVMAVASFLPSVIISVFIPYPLSMLVPVFMLVNEAAVLRSAKIGRTPRYILLSSPLQIATFCAHWVVAPSRSLQLFISPQTFVGLVVFGRLFLDLHMKTIFRSRPDLQFARQKCLISTRGMLTFCFGALALEAIGVSIITYIKPVTLSGLFIIVSALYPAPAAYVVAFDMTREIRK